MSEIVRFAILPGKTPSLVIFFSAGEERESTVIPGNRITRTGVKFPFEMIQQ